MVSKIYPNVSSPIKSIQRGTASSAGTITISAVNISKSFVKTVANGSSGTAAASGTSSGTYTPTGGNVSSSGGSGFITSSGSFPTYSGTRSFTWATTDLTSARYGGYLSNSTSLVVNGACLWEVIEYI